MKNFLVILLVVTSLSYMAYAESGHDDHVHEHTAPHGGTLIVFGDEFAHLELVLDDEKGKITGYVLDGEAENPVRIEQEEIEIIVDRGSDNSKLVKLFAKSNILSGENAGDTSQFEGESPILKGAKKFNAVITKISIKGQEFQDVEFRYPEGNEE